MRCATCGAELLEVGYAVDGFQYYRCPNGCKKIFDWKVKLREAVSIAITLVLFVVVFLFLVIPFAVIGKIYELLGRV